MPDYIWAQEKRLANHGVMVKHVGNKNLKMEKTMPKYLRISSWETFQHYKDRNPAWIKLHTDTFQNYEFSCLHDASKLLAVCIMTLAARYKDPKLGLVPNDMTWIKNQCNLGDGVTEDNLKELVKSGFLVDASDMLAECYQDASLEKEVEGETEGETDTPLTPKGDDVEKKTSKKKEGPFDYSPDFEKFWVVYPSQRKGRKERAWQKWKKALKEGATVEEIMNGLHQYVTSREVMRGYAKNAATWLYNTCWNDTHPQYQDPPSTDDAWEQKIRSYENG